MVKQRTSRVPLWGRILILIPLVPVIVGVYLAGQQERTGLFDASLMAGGNGAGATDLRSALPVVLPASDFTLTDTIQVYGEDNLYVKINGHDVAFFRFGFQSLTFASYGGDSNRYLDVYVYRMKNEENALGIFANERSEEREPLESMANAYRSGGGIFFYRGPWYVQIIPSSESSAERTAVDEMTDSLVSAIPPSPAPLAQLAWFPTADRIALSEGYLPDNAFGTDVLGDVFTAEFALGDARVTAFRHQSDSAATVFVRYSNFLSEMTSSLDPLALGTQEVRRFSSYGEETWLTLSGDNLIGIIAIPEGIRPEALMKSLLNIAGAGPAGGAQS